jgi:hypothetical protein
VSQPGTRKIAKTRLKGLQVLVTAVPGVYVDHNAVIAGRNSQVHARAVTSNPAENDIGIVTRTMDSAL